LLEAWLPACDFRYWGVQNFWRTLNLCNFST
jgi:hypothetical protein